MKRLLVFILAFGVFATACASRTPSPKTTARLAKGYFNHYGKKYKTSEFGISKVGEVDVKEVKELQKDVATSFMVVKLADGTEIPVIMTLIRKLPLGWRTTSWEWARQEAQ